MKHIEQPHPQYGPGSKNVPLYRTVHKCSANSSPDAQVRKPVILSVYIYSNCGTLCHKNQCIWMYQHHLLVAPLQSMALLAIIALWFVYLVQLLICMRSRIYYNKENRSSRKHLMHVTENTHDHQSSAEVTEIHSARGACCYRASLLVLRK